MASIMFTQQMMPWEVPAVGGSSAMSGSRSPTRRATARQADQFARLLRVRSSSNVVSIRTATTSSTCAGIGSTTSMRTAASQHWSMRHRTMPGPAMCPMTATRCSTSSNPSSSTMQQTTRTSRKRLHRLLGVAPTARASRACHSLATHRRAVARPSATVATTPSMERVFGVSVPRHVAHASGSPHPHRHPRVRVVKTMASGRIRFGTTLAVTG
mmetsp:Transcript_44935/g.116733  ORF Transcript_44935/g.116733 Transcript_44935/m.116733 type:complete len:213 (-) Transcript_44935:667-1305(-)